MEAAEIISLIIVIVLNIGVAVWAALANSSLKTCEKNESLACPFIICQHKDPSTTGTNCANTAFRGTGANKVCMTPYVASTLNVNGKVKP